MRLVACSALDLDLIKGQVQKALDLQTRPERGVLPSDTLSLVLSHWQGTDTDKDHRRDSSTLRPKSSHPALVANPPPFHFWVDLRCSKQL